MIVTVGLIVILILTIFLIFYFKKRTGIRSNDFKESELSKKLKEIFKGKRGKIYEQIEQILIEADLGASIVYELLNNIRKQKQIKNYEELKKSIKLELQTILEGSEKKLNLNEKSIILLYGVNGSGKTTSVAKLAYYFKNKGKRVALVAGDTYRAAAKEQLDIWAKRLGVKIYKQEHGADPGAVIYDAITSFKNNKNLDLLIIDTGGRLHNNENLLKQFDKIVRVIKKVWGKLPEESILILDGTVGQNGISQVELFSRVLRPTSIMMTKLDGTAKGGILIQMFNRFKIPISFIGVGEKVTDLIEFSINSYLNFLF